MMPSLSTQTETLVNPLAASPTGLAEATPACSVFAELFQALQPGSAPVADTTALLPQTALSEASLSEASLLKAPELTTAAITPELSEDLTHASVLTALASAIHGLNQGLPRHEAALTDGLASEELPEEALPTPTPEAATPSLVTLPFAINLLRVETPSSITRSSAAPEGKGAMPPVEQALAATALPTSSVANASTATTAINSPPLAWTNGLPASFLNTPVKQEMTPPMGREALLALSGDSAFTSGSPELPKVALTSVGLATGLTLANPQTSSPLPGLVTLTPNALLDPSWSDAFGQRIALLAQQGTQTATLQMNPSDLGPIHVRISLNEQSAKVEFNTLQQTTSDLITAAMPRLAAAMEQQGMRLDDSRVSLMSQRPDSFASQSGFSPRQDSSGQQGGSSSPQPNALEHRQALELRQERAAQAREASHSRTNTGVDYYA